MKQPMAPEIKLRKKYDRDFRQQAVSLWLNSGKAAPQMAAELGISERHLYQWKSDLGPAAGPKLTMAELEAQNLALRRDNDQLRQQRDILKKTLGIISEPPNNVTNGLRR
jgi:transposase